jgi:pyruvate,water dikinase
MTEHPCIVPLRDIDHQPVGGKAAGLARLAGLGLSVPAGFVVVGATPGHLPTGLGAALTGLGADRVAVRSSALAEDGRAASFAGQLETVLDVRGETAVRSAVERCLASAHARRVGAYAASRQAGAVGAVSVVVQRMVDARAAGVCFTADPLTGRRDRIVVDAVAGLGEALVSGHVTPDHHLLTPDGRVVQRELSGATPVLTDAELAALAVDARRAAASLGGPLDLEWAIDHAGELHWLQARPITTLPGDLRELDTPERPGHVLTTSNVSEMHPGPMDPLTISTTGVGIDRGTQSIFAACGAVPAVVEEHRPAAFHYGHLFFDLTNFLPMTARVPGSSPELMALAICGRTIPELGPDGTPPAGPLTLARNGLRYARFVLGAADAVDAFARRRARWSVPPAPTAATQWAALDRGLPFLRAAYDMHLRASAPSGLSSGILQGVVSRGRPPTPAEEAELAALLAGAGDVVSAELLTELDALGASLAGAPGVDTAFLGVPPEAAQAWLREAAPRPVRLAYAAFLARHGHRAYRELSMRQRGWADDPEPLVRSLQQTVAARRQRSTSTRPRVHRPEATPATRGLAFRALLGWSRRSVQLRERAKSLLVDVTNELKRGYRRLGDHLAAEGLLPDPDAVFFLSHDELGELTCTRDPGLAHRATRRREVLALQERLRFPDVSIGLPEPLDDAPIAAGGGALVGKPVSRGTVEGVARVVRDLAGAEALRPGEILIAPVTDVGWTPYFSLLAGLATDLGSALSHGAVVAREYGLPAVVNLRHATTTFRTGDRVRLDGDRGTLERIARG